MTEGQVTTINFISGMDFEGGGKRRRNEGEGKLTRRLFTNTRFVRKTIDSFRAHLLRYFAEGMGRNKNWGTVVKFAI